MRLSPIHPFPARMAPEIVFHQLRGMASDALVLDPMVGSGTVLRAAAELGHRAIGFDLDPLAVLMARVWTTPFRAKDLPKAAERFVQRAKFLHDEYLPWIDDCEETQDYLKFWFCGKQRKSLRRLSFLLAQESGALGDALKIALSRIIITKERGASVARDTSHSRPHRVFFENDYDVYEGFLQSAKRLTSRLALEKVLGTVTVRRGDARQLTRLAPGSVGAIITSPPYLNAIDYLRGHRLSLVWLGYGLSEIRTLRSDSIGAESSAKAEISEPKLDKLLFGAGDVERLPARELGMVRRYAQDVFGFMKELARVAKKGGRLLLVVGNSCLKGVPISNADINVAAAKLVGFDATGRSERSLPGAHRYLPLPGARNSGSLARRMRTETLLSFSMQ
jgi:tRNA G10  N-methylase Trm11